MKKKGSSETFFAEQTASLVIGGLITLLLVISAIYFFDNLNADVEQESVESTLNRIEGIINEQKIGDVNSYTFQGFPQTHDWKIIGFSKQQEGPDKCFGSGCICICFGDCDNKGFCKKLEIEEVKVEEIVRARERIEINPGPKDGFEFPIYREGEIKITRNPSIRIPASFYLITIKKENTNGKTLVELTGDIQNEITKEE